MFDKFMKLFSPDKKNDSTTAAALFGNSKNLNNSENVCLNLNDNRNCNKCFLGTNFDKKIGCEYINDCELSKKWVIDLPNYDKDKDSILIVDDNPGIISFMVDDLVDIDGSENFKLDNYNLLTFDTKFAAFQFEATQQKYGGLNIKYAILDLTLGGTLATKNGPVKYTGIDIFQQILIFNPEVKVLFYTGNSLNDYVRASQKLINQFHDLTGKDIMDFVLFKTSLDLYGRRDFLKEWFKE